jgi:hypothetical protein
MYAGIQANGFAYCVMVAVCNQVGMDTHRKEVQGMLKLDIGIMSIELLKKLRAKYGDITIKELWWKTHQN